LQLIIQVGGHRIVRATGASASIDGHGVAVVGTMVDLQQEILKSFLDCLEESVLIPTYYSSVRHTHSAAGSFSSLPPRTAESALPLLPKKRG
jgi:hypothetical protein